MVRWNLLSRDGAFGCWLLAVRVESVKEALEKDYVTFIADSKNLKGGMMK